MEIRRVEPDLITPAAANDRTARVEMDRRGHQQPEQQDQPDRQPDAEADAPEYAAESTTTYDPDGTVRERPATENEASHIDFRA